MKSMLKLLTLLMAPALMAQTNLLDDSTWTEDSGSVTGFTRYGYIASNVREMEVGPHGGSVLIWKAKAGSLSDSDGGWNSDYVTIDPTKAYRFTVWTKKIGSHDGTSYFGMNAKDASDNHASHDLNGSSNTNPYFKTSDFPALNEWYLQVGYVYPAGATSNGTDGLYDTNGTLLYSTYGDFEFAGTAVKARHRVYLRLTDTPNEQYFYAPTIYEVNGQEPTIQELIDGTTASAPSPWTNASTTLYYTDGNVGIGDAVLDQDEVLGVNGTIHSKEVLVDMVGWPDYVFEKGHALPSLEAVEAHINKTGHLLGVPSAKTMEANGQELGEMHKLLLEKIEELTLYILQQEQDMLQQEERIKKLGQQK